MNKWIKCSESLPEEEKDYLTYVIDNGCSYFFKIQRFYKNPRIINGIYAHCSTHWELTEWDDNVVLYWMELPKPPIEYRYYGQCFFINDLNRMGHCSDSTIVEFGFKNGLGINIDFESFEERDKEVEKIRKLWS